MGSLLRPFFECITPSFERFEINTQNFRLGKYYGCFCRLAVLVTGIFRHKAVKKFTVIWRDMRKNKKPIVSLDAALMPSNNLIQHIVLDGPLDNDHGLL
jgi:hypothetical protein